MRPPALGWRAAVTAATAGAMVFGVVIRVVLWLQGRPLWLDEQLVALNLRNRGYDLTGVLDYHQSAPLGWLYVQRWMMATFGEGERALRVVPLLFGVGTVVVAWLVARAFLGPAGGFALTSLTAVNGYLVEYSVEVKHYSADAFFGLALLGLALWVLRAPQSLRRWGLWWAVAAAGTLLSMGAILIVPGLFLVLLVTTWRRAGQRRALQAWAVGAVWFVAFLVDYLLAIGATAVGSDFMHNYWRDGFAPAGPVDYVGWLAQRLSALSEFPLLLQSGLGDEGKVWRLLVGGPFWVAVVVGVVLAWRRQRPLGLLLLAPLASAILLATAQVVPLLDRQTLWLVPSLFAAVGFAVDGAAGLLTAPPSSTRVPARVVTAGAVVALLPLLLVVNYGRVDVQTAAAPPDHDDRAGVQYMQAIHRDGDLLLFIGLTGYAADWYDRDDELQGRRDVAADSDRACPDELAAATRGYRRVIVYAGATVAGNGEWTVPVVSALATLGRLETTRFAGTSAVHAIDLTQPPDPRAEAPAECVYLLDPSWR